MRPLSLGGGEHRHSGISSEPGGQTWWMIGKDVGGTRASSGQPPPFTVGDYLPNLDLMNHRVGRVYRNHHASVTHPSAAVRCTPGSKKARLLYTLSRNEKKEVHTAVSYHLLDGSAESDHGKGKVSGYGGIESNLKLLKGKEQSHSCKSFGDRP